jgi:integrase
MSLLNRTFERPEVTEPIKVKRAPYVKDYCDEFLKTYARIHNKPSEQYNKKAMIRAYVGPLLGKRRLDEVGAREIETFKAKLLDSGLRPKTVNNVLAMLGKMLRYAVDVGDLGAAPRIRLLKVAQQPFDFLNFEEYAALLEAARTEPESYTAVVFAGDTGARMGELLALEWDDVDFRTGVVRIARSEWMGVLTGTKTGKVRTLPMTRRLQTALSAHRHLRGKRVFCRDDGSPWTKEVLRAMLPRLCKRAGLRRIKWHALRHTFASHLAMRGVHPREIQELGGWSTLSMVLRYTHLTQTQLRRAIDALEWQPNDNGRTQQMERA